MSTKLEHPDGLYGFPNIDEQMMISRYGDRERLGEEWRDKRKATAAAKNMPDGTPNPHYPRLLIEENQARTFYDLAFLFEENRLLKQGMGYMEEVMRRLNVVEAAYSHVMLKVGSSGLNEPTMGLIRRVTEMNQRLEREVQELRAERDKKD